MAPTHGPPFQFSNPPLLPMATYDESPTHRESLVYNIVFDRSNSFPYPDSSPTPPKASILVNSLLKNSLADLLHKPRSILFAPLKECLPYDSFVLEVSLGKEVFDYISYDEKYALIGRFNRLRSSLSSLHF